MAGSLPATEICLRVRWRKTPGRLALSASMALRSRLPPRFPAKAASRCTETAAVPPRTAYWKAVPTGMSIETPALQHGHSSPLSSRRQISPRPDSSAQNSLTVAWSRPVHLPWRTADSHRRRASSNTDPRPGGGARIGVLGNRAGLHGHPSEARPPAYAVTARNNANPPAPQYFRAGGSAAALMRFGWVRLSVQAKEVADAPDRLRGEDNMREHRAAATTAELLYITGTVAVSLL